MIIVLTLAICLPLRANTLSVQVTEVHGLLRSPAMRTHHAESSPIVIGKFAPAHQNLTKPVFILQVLQLAVAIIQFTVRLHPWTYDMVLLYQNVISPPELTQTLTGVNNIVVAKLHLRHSSEKVIRSSSLFLPWFRKQTFGSFSLMWKWNCLHYSQVSQAGHCAK